MDNLEETGKYTKTAPETGSLSRPVRSEETGPVVSFPTQETPDSFTGEPDQTVKKELTPNLLKSFQKTEGEGALLNSFSEASVTLIPKPDKDTTREV